MEIGTSRLRWKSSIGARMFPETPPLYGNIIVDCTHGEVPFDEFVYLLIKAERKARCIQDLADAIRERFIVVRRSDTAVVPRI